MNATALHRFTIEEQLRGALERNEFTLQYQPQFDVRTGEISGIEALLRWTNAQLGAVSPTEFIPVAEETGLILSIGKWALRSACQQAQAWRAEGLPVKRIAVNVSGRQFALAEYPAEVRAMLQETGLDPSVLELEITESVVMADEVWAREGHQPAQAARHLARHRRLRHRLLELRPPAALRRRPAQDRPLVRHQRHRAQRRPGDRRRPSSPCRARCTSA